MAARTLSARIGVELDDGLGESAAVLQWSGGAIEVDAARGSPFHPMTAEELDQKVRELSGERLIGCLEDLNRPAQEVLEMVVGE